MKKLIVLFVIAAAFVPGLAPLFNHKKAEITFTLPRPRALVAFTLPRPRVEVAFTLPRPHGPVVFTLPHPRTQLA